MIVDEVKKIILNLCEKEEWSWRNHIEAVVKYSKELVKKIGGDEEIVVLAAWLHDISKVKGNPEGHHISGAEEAGNILKELGYPEKRIEQVRHCILTHSSDKTYMPESKEAKILASADALSHFDVFLEFAHYCLVLNKENPEEARRTLIGKYARSWDKLMPEAKEMAKKKYEAIKLLLGASS